jgi:glycosyltransferase involved in cell wall biosynthesis
VTSDRPHATQPVVALIPWGLTIEDFLEPHGVTLETFCREFRGSWMFRGHGQCRGVAGWSSPRQRRPGASSRPTASRPSASSRFRIRSTSRCGGRETASAPRAKLGIDPAASVAVWHGRTDIWKKGLDVLLEAWERLHDGSASEFQLVLIGDGPDAQDVSEEIGRLRTPDVTFVNRLVHDSEALRDYLLAGDVYGFPSRHEGFAIAPIEAMASGFRSSPPSIAGVEHGLATSRERTVGSR